MMIWCKGATKYGVNNDEEICEFIDEFVTCSQPDIDDPFFELVNLQVHRLSHTCKKKKVKECRFGYPKPPMRNTTSLQPLPTDEFTRKQIETYRKNFRLIQEHLNKEEAIENLTLEQFFGKLYISEEDYILSIRSSLKTATVFLKRTLKETWHHLLILFFFSFFLVKTL